MLTVELMVIKSSPQIEHGDVLPHLVSEIVTPDSFKIFRISWVGACRPHEEMLVFEFIVVLLDQVDAVYPDCIKAAALNYRVVRQQVVGAYFRVFAKVAGELFGYHFRIRFCVAINGTVYYDDLIH